MKGSFDLDRRSFLVSCAAAVPAGLGLAADDKKRKTKVDDGFAWHDVSKWGVEGRGFDDVEHFYDRLPKRAKGVVRGAVWNLSRHSAGMLVRFETDAREIWVDYSLVSNRLDMPHMPATGVSGMDLYCETKEGRYLWLGVVKPNGAKVKKRIVGGIPRALRNYTLYLPLYNGVNSLSIGVPNVAKFKSKVLAREKPVLFYGTSITQGGCASRPGMAYPSIVGRRIGRPVINLGFSGNGLMEKEVVRFIKEIDVAAFVIDCLPNMTAKQVAKRTEPLVRSLREKRGKTPVLLMECPTYCNAWLVSFRRKLQVQRRKALCLAFKRLKAAGVKNLFYLSGDTLIGGDGEGTVDGTHPTDLGMIRYADAVTPILKKIL